MSLRLHKSEFFLDDFEAQFRWYQEEAGLEIAERYLHAVDKTLKRLSDYPDLGRLRRFAHPQLQGLRSYMVSKPFQRHLIFYRPCGSHLELVRIMHSARDLPKRLRQPPGSEDEASLGR